MKPAVRSNRMLVRAAVCPECGAKPYAKCLGSRGNPRTSCHQPRWQAYRDLQAPAKGPMQ